MSVGTAGAKSRFDFRGLNWQLFDIGNMKILKQTCSLLALASVATFISTASLRAGDEKVPLTIKLPAPAFKGTPKELPEGMTVEPMTDKEPAPILVPAGCVNLAAGLVPTTSDTNVAPAKLVKITDGNKEAYEEQIVLLRKGVQYIQFDLKKPAEIYAIALWHAHDAAKVYRSVVVQLADDAGFTQNVRTVFNNDTENKAGQGAGTDKQYYEQHWGKRIDVKGQKAQFVRFYSRGSTESALNEYTEVEIWGKPAQ
jgi:hypothetical protein